MGDDVKNFLKALIFNYLIAGTDGHAKNYGMLIAGQGQFRLAPLYDVISILPYKHQPRKLKLAMKVGDEYLLWKINRHQWEKAAKEWRMEPEWVIEQVKWMSSAIPEVAQAVSGEVGDALGVNSKVLQQLKTQISGRAATSLAELG